MPCLRGIVGMIPFQINEPGRDIMQQITKIVITGGPCAGKTTAMSWIQNSFTRRGYVVLFVPETATELISGGVAPWTCGTNFDYQVCQCALQMEKERIFKKAARTMPQEKILIVCDRGMFDNKAYMTDKEFNDIIDRMGLTLDEVTNQYGAVFHLMTAAKGAEEYYTTANNSARTETVEQAIALDDTIIHCWKDHPHFRVIDNSTDFEGKMVRLISEISEFLGVHLPYRTKRKFLIEYPDINILEADNECHKVEVVRTYLLSNPGEEIRIRKRGTGNYFTYFLNTRITASTGEIIETEKQLTSDEYQVLELQADPEMRKISKKRYCFTFEKQYFELDLYSLWNDQAIVEVETSEIEKPIHFPEFVKVIRELTGVESYRNAVLARK